ncbi:MAG: serine/threonine protein kinase, partial [Planctomycetales bacterium]
MTTTTTISFWRLLKRSNLLTARQFAQVRTAAAKADLSEKPRALTQALVKRGLLTNWQATQLLAGQRAFFLGKYKLLDRLGSGGMGSVFRSLDTKTHRVVALKVLSEERMNNQSAVARFRREIDAAMRLDHPNIIAALDSDRVGRTYFLVMEYSAGIDLHQWVKQRGPLPIPLACDFTRQAALGLQHAHEQGMVHRDVKPANLLVVQHPVNGEPIVKLLDMGLARFVSEESVEGELTETGQILGTPDYIAPEQAKNTRKADIRADV